MTTVPPIGPGTTAATTNQATPTEPKSAADKGAVITSDFETFLTMLTAQLENQDPLNPIESSDYAVQLATFSSVEQQVLTNDLLREMVDGGGATGLAATADWVGREVQTAGPVYFRGPAQQFDFDLPGDAARSDLVVRNVAGAEVWRLDVTGTTGTAIWPGTDARGRGVAEGTYTAELVSYARDGEATVSDARGFNEVSELRFQDGKAELVLRGGATVSPDQVTALR